MDEWINYKAAEIELSSGSATISIGAMSLDNIHHTPKTRVVYGLVVETTQGSITAYQDRTNGPIHVSRSRQPLTLVNAELKRARGLDPDLAKGLTLLLSEIEKRADTLPV